MSDRPSHNLGGLDIEMARRIDKVCRRFEADWRAGRQPGIEDYVVDVSHQGRPALRAELEALERELSLSEETSARPGVVSATTAEAQGSSLGDPCTIGRYRVIRLLGQGGFGRVYLAHDDDTRPPGGDQGPNPERVSGPEDVEAYLTEARILARLDHPNIVPVYDVGRTDDGLCFVVSKYIEGSDLADRIEAGPAVASGSRRSWWRRSPRRCTTPTPEAWSTGTSSPPTS